MVPRYRPKRAKKNQKRLTEANVRSLSPKGKQYLTWDDPAGKEAAYGLAVLVSPHGIKSYRAVYYLGGKPRYKYLGRVGEVTLEEAREATRKVRRSAREGNDPGASDPRRSQTFRAVAEDFARFELIGNRKNLRAEETRKVILSHTGAWHDRPIGTIRPDEIEALLWRVRDGDENRRGTPVMANRLHVHLKDLFKWAARATGPLASSPMVDIKRPVKRQKARDLPWFRGEAANEAVRKLWAAANEIGGVGGQYIKAMVLTGKRSGSMAAMRWEEIARDGFWTPPKPEAENKRNHPVPLSSLAQRVLEPRREEGEVFAGVGDLRQLQNRVRRLTGIEDFIWHGLRHVAETKTGELRVPPHIRDCLFDHAPKRGAGQDYDHHEYVPEMRAAAETWAKHVEGLVAEKGVALLR